ncbi:MAG: hypothetical protein JNM55_12040 [Anaerolineales bacterium]|nr:hypothetical protein [Anaerolineales bacterium]
MENEVQKNPEETEETEVIEEETIGDVLVDFVDNITSLSETLPITMQSVIFAFNETVKRQEAFEKENVKPDNDDENAMWVKEGTLYEFLELHKQIKNYGLALRIIPRSLIVSLISQYDAFLGELLKKIFLIRPEMLNASEKPLTLAQLVEFGSVENAKEFVLEKEVESVLRKSHAEQFQWMESKFDMPLRKNLDVWSRFVELTERRNLFVHTDGIISSQYLKACKEHGVSWSKEIEVGDDLDVTPEYFSDAVNIMFEIGVKLAHVLWRKFKIEDLEEADDNLIEIAFEPLKAGNYALAKNLFTFGADTLKKHFNHENRRIFVVNKALAYKWGGEDKKARNIISAEDWSDTRDKFRLAEAVILEDYSKAYQIMREIGKNPKEIRKDDYKTWPLFKAIRDEVEFQKTYEEIFGEPLNKIEKEEVYEEDEVATNE